MTSPSYPLGAPLLTGGSTLTVDLALRQPQILTRRLADTTAQRYVTDRIFRTSGQSVAAGALIYEQIRPNENFLTRPIEQRMPSDEYPIVSGPRPVAQVARAEDWGGKFFITDEARSRNDSRLLDDEMTQLGNTIVRRVNERAIETLEASLTGETTFVGHRWDTFETQGTTPTPRREQPVADFAVAQTLAERDELGVTFDTWLINPQEWESIKIGYSDELPGVLEAAGVELFASNRVPAGTAYAVASQAVGFLEYEQQLTTAVWREEATRRTWVQSFVMPVMGVTNPRAIRKVVGLHA